MVSEPVSRGEYRVNVTKLDRTGMPGIVIPLHLAMRHCVRATVRSWQIHIQVLQRGHRPTVTRGRASGNVNSPVHWTCDWVRLPCTTCTGAPLRCRCK